MDYDRQFANHHRFYTRLNRPIPVFYTVKPIQMNPRRDLDLVVRLIADLSLTYLLLAPQQIRPQSGRLTKFSFFILFCRRSF